LYAARLFDTSAVCISPPAWPAGVGRLSKSRNCTIVVSMGLREDSKEEQPAGDEIRRIRTVYAERERLLHARWDQGNLGNRLLASECRAAMERLLKERFALPLANCRVLDVGCGYGGLVSSLHDCGVRPENLFGVDLLPNRIEFARTTFPSFTFVEGNAERLDFPDDSFDLVSVFTVFSSILDHVMASNVAREITRVLAGGGAVLWYDMRYPNPWNSGLRAMTRGRIRELFPAFSLELQSLSLFPPVARRLGPITQWAYPLLAGLPALRTHYLGLLRLGPKHA
jgi:ubiquinone/menaquinone biosynthesis C-methylase UbiE